MRIGTDTSFWAENVDYEKMIANGAEFTILRAGQGSWIDNYFQKNYDASDGMLPRSAYWFFDQRYKPSRQAELLAAALKDNPLEGYIWADYERDYEGANYAKWEDFHTFLREIERLIPEMVGRIGVYTRYYYWKDHVPQDKWYLFEKYPFWEARYEAEAPFDKPFKCLLWQYSEKGDGLAYGLDPYVKKFIDLNYFKGTDEEWEHFTGNMTIPEPEITPSKVFWKMKAKDGTLVVPFSRTPDLGEVNKIQLTFMPNSEIYEFLPMPKFRNHSGNLVPNYETEADRLNLERDWAFIPIQEVLKNNGNYRMLHTDWDVDNWDINGCYIQRQYLVETEQPKPTEYKVTVTSPSGVNIRTTPGVESENKVGAMWRGSNLIGSELIEKDNGDKWLRLKDNFVAVEYNGEVLLELEEDIVPDERRSDWKPDPDRPEKLYYSRHTGYYKVPVRSLAGSLKFEAPQSAIFIGDRKILNMLHVIRMNGDIVDGWINTSAKDMICHKIPEETLNSLIPPKIKEPTITTHITVPDDGDYVYFYHADTKDHAETQPDTVVLWEDKPHQPGWMDTTPEMQWLFFDLLKLSAPGNSIIYYVMAYAYMYADNRFWTDLQDKDEHRDDILGLYPDRPCYKIKHSIITRGNPFYVNNKVSNASFSLGGVDPNKPMPYAEDIIGNPRYTFMPTQQGTKILPNKAPKVTHQPGIKQIVDGREEKTGMWFVKFASPHLCPKEKGFIWCENNKDYPVVNLERFY